MRAVFCSPAAPAVAAASSRYVPKFIPPGMAAALAGGPSVKHEEARPKPAAAAPRAGGSERKPRKIDMMLQTLKRWAPFRRCSPPAKQCGQKLRGPTQNIRTTRFLWDYFHVNGTGRVQLIQTGRGEGVCPVLRFRVMTLKRGVWERGGGSACDREQERESRQQELRDLGSGPKPPDR